MAIQQRKLEDGREYAFSTIERLVRSHNLDPSALDDDDDETIESYATLMPIRFSGGELAASFLLTGYGQESIWKCVYVCPSLEGITF